MSEDDVMDYLKKEDYYEKGKPIKICVPPAKSECPTNSSQKTKVMILPLSIEDEVKTCGTANVLKEFARDLNIKGLKSILCLIRKIRNLTSKQQEKDTFSTRNWIIITKKW